MTTPRGGYRRNRKTRDRALILVLVGLALLMPPLAPIFHVDGKLFSLPVTLIYLFAVWAALIFCAARLARPLQATDEDGDSAP